MREKINYNMLEESFIAFFKKEYERNITIDQLQLTPAYFGLDSLDAVEMLLWAEEKYGIKTTPEDYSENQTFLEFLDLVYKRIPKSKKI